MLIFVLLLVMAGALVPIPAYADEQPVTKYVKTDNGHSVPVRAQPDKNADQLGRVSYGDAVQVIGVKRSWSCIVWKGSGKAYIQTRYLVDEKPEPFPSKPTATPKPTKDKPTATPKPTSKPTKSPQEQQELLNKELASERELTPFYIATRPGRASGWVVFRVGPSTITSSIASFPANKELVAVGETNNWYRARDLETGRIGYIPKNQTIKLDKPYVDSETAGEPEKLGRLSVNGEFELTCRLPEGYALQVVDIREESIIASVTSEDATKPQMYLSIAYDDLYGAVDRMNDLTDEELAILEETFTSEYEVEIEYRETGYGTKLLVAREVGADVDFVTFLSVYKGYFVEFTLTPNPSLPDQALTEEQIQMCIDFLTDVDFNPVEP